MRHIRIRKYIQENDLDKYVNALVEFWSERPPEVSHGLTHCLDVVQNCKTYGELNEYEDIRSLVIYGIFHDIVRPVLGEGGNEDQSESPVVTKEILSKLDTPKESINKIINVMAAHDDWQDDKDVDIFTLISSFADKASLNIFQSYSYAWAANRYFESAGKPPVYSTHQNLVSDFAKYQTRAWKIFKNFHQDLQGSEIAIRNYAEAFNGFTSTLLTDPENLTFNETLEQMATLYARYEYQAYKTFNIDEELIEKCMVKFEGLDYKG